MQRFKSSATLGIVTALLMLVGGATVPCGVNAQAGCADQCRAAYGGCYKATSNRAACESLLQRCLHGCIGPKR
jgi:hypothetical protein